MISQNQRLLNRLQHCVWTDPKDDTKIHVNFDQVLRILKEYNIVVPPKRFEQEVQKFLDEKLVGALPAVPSIARNIIGTLLYDFSSEMAVPEDQLLKHKIQLENDNSV